MTMKHNKRMQSVHESNAEYKDYSANTYHQISLAVIELRGQAFDFENQNKK
jgi:hypothetical protein